MENTLDLDEMKELEKLEDELIHNADLDDIEKLEGVNLEDVQEDDEDEIEIEFVYDKEEEEEEEEEDEEEVRVPHHSIRKIKKLKKRMNEIEIELAEELEQCGYTAYAEELECDYDRLQNEVHELEHASKSKGGHFKAKKCILGIAGVLTAIASIVVVVMKIRSTIKKKK